MPRQIATGSPLCRLTLLLAALLAASAGIGVTPAGAVVQGRYSSLGYYTVRLIGPFNCSGVAIGRRLVVTAAHCARRGMRIVGGGATGIAGVTRSAVLDDGRRVTVSGDAAILRLTAPLSSGIAPIGNGGGATFTIAGYGTTDERNSGAFGALHEASLVAGPGRQLVDPRRSGAISASACFGDSGGPVMRGGMLAGVITRANYPRKRIACGFYTRWAPVRVHGQPRAVTAEYAAAETRPRKHRRHATRTKARAPKAVTATFNIFNWFTPKPQPPKSKRRRTARR